MNNDFENMLNDIAVKYMSEFYIATQRAWKNMYDCHITPLNNRYQIDLLNSAQLTTYVNYAKKIKDHEIRLPDWFVLSAGTRCQKIVPCYDTESDIMGIVLMDMYSVRGKTLMIYHMSNSTTRNGMHVTDIITRNMCNVFGTPIYLGYIRSHSVSPEQCFMIRNPLSSYYEHLKHALLHSDLRRIMAVSARQIILVTQILKDMRSNLVEEIMLIDLERGNAIQEILYDDKYLDMDRIYEKLWPDLELIVCASHGNMRIYAERIRKYIGNIKLYSPVYSIPECTIGYNIDNDGCYVMDPRKGYFEFIPVKKDFLNYNVEDHRTVSIRHVEYGCLYVLVASTTSSDMKRYVTGEVIRVIDKINGSPKIDIICHIQDILFVKDSIITPHDIEIALYKHYSNSSINTLIDYCYRKNENIYIMYIELDDESYLKDDKYVYDVRQRVKDIDIQKHILEQIGIDFQIKIVRPGTFNTMFQSRYSQYIDISLIQIPRRITNSDDKQILRDNIIYVY